MLAKSAAALLVKRHLHSVPDRWRIIAAPYTGATKSHDFDTLLGDTRPFDIGVKIWIKQFETEDWIAIYRARSVVVFFLFAFSQHDLSERMRTTFHDTARLQFEGQHLNELLDGKWVPV